MTDKKKTVSKADAIRKAAATLKARGREASSHGHQGEACCFKGELDKSDANELNP